jgi:hypothetical protein
MRERLLWIGVWLALYATIHVGFYLWKETRKAKVWKLIPQSAVAVFSLQNALSTLEAVYADLTLEQLMETEPLSDVFVSSQSLDSLFSLEPKIKGLLSSAPVWVSVHAYPSKLQALHFVKLEKHYGNSWIDSAATQMGNLKTRKYKNFFIRELYTHSGNLIYCFTLYKDCFVGSSNPVLLEDVIRKTAKFSQGSYFYTLQKQFDDVGISSQVRLYFDAEKLQGLLRELLPDFPVFKRSGRLFLTFAESQIELSGEFLPKAFGRKDVLDLVQKTDPQLVRVPKELAALAVIPLGESRDFSRKLKALRSEDLFNSSPLAQRFAAELKGNMTLFFFKTKLGQSRPKLAVFESDQAIKLLELISDEPVQDSVLVSAKVELAEDIFGKEGFEKGFAMVIQNKLLYSNSAKTIADYLLWQKRKDIFDTLTISGAFFAANTLSLWEDFTQAVRPEHKLFVENQKKTWSKFLDISAEFFQKEKQLKAKINLGFKKSTKHIYAAPDSSQRFCAFKNPVMAGPWLSVNPLSGLEEVLVFESESGFFLLNHEGKVISAHPLRDIEAQSFQQIDLYANGKTQFFVVGGGVVRCFDRTGKSVLDFPIKAQEPVFQANMLDFAGKRNYMLAALTPKGALYGFSKYATPLKSWQPVQLGSSPCPRVEGIFFGKESFVITLTQDGTARVFDELAQIRSGFPLNFKVPVSGSFAVQNGSSPSDSRVRFVTHGGELIDFDLLGTVRGRQNLLGISNASFELAFDPKDPDKFVVCAQNETEMAVFSENGELLFKKELFEPKTKKFQYHDLGRNTQVIAVFDAMTRKAMFYDLGGNPLLSQAITANHAHFAFLYQEATDSYKAVYALHNKLLFTRFDR